MALNSMCAYTPKEQMVSNAMWFSMFNHVEGDYLEFGVATGDTFLAAYHLAQYLKRTPLHRHSRRFFGFDSFQGLPPIQGLDAEQGAPFKQGDYAYNLTYVRKKFGRQGIDWRHVTLVPGWFHDTLTQDTKQALGLSKAAIIWIDCDLYRSTVPVLQFIADLIQDGTVIIFDDWFVFRGSPDHGEQRAFKEWLEQHHDIRATEFARYGWHGIAFLLHRAGAGSEPNFEMAADRSQETPVS